MVIYESLNVWQIKKLTQKQKAIILKLQKKNIENVEDEYRGVIGVHNGKFSFQFTIIKLMHL